MNMASSSDSNQSCPAPVNKIEDTASVASEASEASEGETNGQPIEHPAGAPVNRLENADIGDLTFPEITLENLETKPKSRVLQGL